VSRQDDEAVGVATPDDLDGERWSICAMAV